jgi:urea transport system substrate-binding protein
MSPKCLQHSPSKRQKFNQRKGATMSTPKTHLIDLMITNLKGATMSNTQPIQSQESSGNSASRRSVLKSAAAIAVTTGGMGFPAIVSAQSNKVKIGFHSGLTGLETILGETQLNCFKLAVDEINAAGGAGGRRVEYLVEDNQTTTRGAIDKTRKFIMQDKVDVIVGMITSLERQAALSVSSPAKKLVIYPTYYEGGECNRYLVCTGQVPNQSVDTFVPWLEKNVGKSVYIVGSDYVWPRKTAEAISAAFAKMGGKTINMEFFPFGTQDFAPTLDRIRAAKPDIVWEMFAGADAVSFLKQFASFKPGSRLVTNGLDELFTTSIGGSAVEGIIVNQSYFMTLNKPANKSFITRYQAKFGKNSLVNAIGEATYVGTWLYAKAVAKAGSTDTEKVIRAMSQVVFEAPQGTARINAANQHLITNSIIGTCRKDGMFDIVQEFGPVDPVVPGCRIA